MLTRLQLSNFKSWQELDMPLGRVTGLFGTNSSGKSSILQFLLMLKQTKNATDRGFVLDFGGSGELVNLGTFKDLIYKHQEYLSLKWSISWNRNEIPQELFNTSVEVIFVDKQIKLNFLKHSLNNYLNISEDYFFEIETINDPVKKYKFKSKIGKIEFTHSTQPVKTYLFPTETANSDDGNILKEIEFEYENIIDKIYYLAPLREYPQREYRWSGASPSDVGIRGENAINAILAATIRKETRMTPNSDQEKPFQEIIAYWLKELGLIHEFFVKEIADGTGLFRAIVKTSPQSPEAFLTDVGFGVSQVLPALVLLYYVPEGSIILMEQPEIHLHPSVQSGLADVILQVSKQRNLQVIVESHSEHLLRRFQRRIAEEKYPADELKLYFCDNSQGTSKLLDLEIDEFGDIHNWPDNFFGDDMAEIVATRKAALKRKMQEL